ncbi:MAG: ABC transporter permease [Proteobacteria bacterium]|nr:ABC transporter permease [Pseudomonadota bacterium]
MSKIFRMGDQTLNALDHVDLDIHEGEFVAIVGPSGSGKSTLMHMIGLLDTADEGTFELGGLDVLKLSEKSMAEIRSKTVGFIFQQFNLLARTSAAENVGLPMLYGGKTYDPSWPLKLLKAVGLANRSDHKPNQLSGGQQQRVAIARSLVNKPLILLADEPTGNLDSQSEKDILDILVRLNRAGITVIIVTHELEVTGIAGRVIKMRDGKIVSDEIQKPIYIEGMSSLSDSEENELKSLYFDSAQLSEDQRRGAKVLSHVREATRAIFANKVRSVLSILGILIGVAAVIAMLGLGAGAKESMEQQLSSLGSNLLVVYAGSSRPTVGPSGSNISFSLEDVELLKKNLDNMINISGRVDARGSKSTVQFGEKTWNPTVSGASAAYATMRAAQPTKGRFFTEAEDRARARVALVGIRVIEKLFGDQDPIGQQIKINKVYFEVIGILPEKGASTWQDQDDIVVIPLETAMRRTFGYDNVQMIDIQVDDADNISRVENQIRSLLAVRKRLEPDQAKESIQVRNMSEIRDAISSTSKIMSTLLAIIAGISLLVGGIGVMNIMLVSLLPNAPEKLGLGKPLEPPLTTLKLNF